MKKVEFEIKGRPVPWKRMRRNGKQYFADEGQAEAKDIIRLHYNAAERAKGLLGTPYEGPVALTVYAVFKLPETLRKGDTRRMGSPHIIKPDGDNLAKLVKDALNGLAYKDDCQVYETVIRKQWSDYNMTRVTLEYPFATFQQGRAA